MSWIAGIARVALYASLLTGCASMYNSSEGLRAKPHQKGSITLADPYSAVFANITASATKCFPGTLLDRGSYLLTASQPRTYVESVELEPGKLAKVEAL